MVSWLGEGAAHGGHENEKSDMMVIIWDLRAPGLRWSSAPSLAANVDETSINIY